MVSTRSVRFLPGRKVNAVNPAGGLSRWGTPPAGRPPRRRPGHHRRGVSRRGTPAGVRRRGWVITLVARVNNFWGTLHRGGRLLLGISAGATGVPKAGGPAAAGVARRVGEVYGRRPRRPRRGGRRPVYLWGRRRWRGLSPGEAPRRRPRRWRRRARRGPRRRWSPVVVSLVGWSRDRRWRHAWGSLGVTGRVRVVVHPVRSHNGLRGKKPRRT